ncbi:MAG TPA: YceI family protein [Solimonas sp.]|nr:YceI family protein [Solimonas sp.]
MLRSCLLAALLICATVPAPAAERYTLDAAHTYPSLEMSHMGLSIWRGKFNHSSGHVVMDRKARTGTVEVKVQSASIDFGHDKMNEHASDPDWLAVEKYPTIDYRGKLVFEGDTPRAVDGELTLRGVTRPLRLKINQFKCIDHPYYKKEACGADAEGEFNRADFGMTQYSEGEAGRIRLRIQVEALKDG